MTARLRRAAAPLAAVLVLGVVSCSGDDEPAAEATTSDETTETTEPTEEPTDDESTEPTEGDLGPGSGLRRFTEQDVQWSDCGGGYECATVLVPVDYADLAGDTVSLAVKRLPADDQRDRIGSLLINPGGPGGSGVDYLTTLAGELGDDVLAAYDVVGFDPRGVAASDPVECLGDEQLDAFLAFDPDPDTDAEVDRAVELSSEFAAGCADDAPELLPHLSTADVARDLDVLRVVLGDDQLHYYGASYGTFIGAVYAELFPQRVGRLALDGAVDPSLSSQETSIAQAAGFETALRSYVEDCVSGGDCVLGSTVDEGVATIEKLMAELDQDPLPTADGRELTRGLGFFGLITPLYQEAAWPYLTQALSAALDGDGSVLLTLSDLYHMREDGQYTSNGSQAIYAVNCLDSPTDASPADVEASIPDFVRASPTFGEVLAWGSLACTEWPVDAAEPPPEQYDARGAEPILVVGTTRDPATPYEWAVSLADQLESGVLLTREGDGHTGYAMGNACIDDAVDSYLVDGTVPDDGTRC